MGLSHFSAFCVLALHKNHLTAAGFVSPFCFLYVLGLHNYHLTADGFALPLYSVTVFGFGFVVFVCLFVFCTCIVLLGFLLWEIQVTFPVESQL